MKRVIVSALAVLVAGQVFAEETKDTRAAAEKLLELFNMEATFDQAMGQAMQMSVGMIDSQDLPESEKVEARKAVEASMKITLEKFSWDRMKGMFVDIYAEVLSLEELEGLIAFYESPIGRKFIKKQPELTSATMQKMQGLMQELMPEIQKEVEKAVTEKKPGQ
jgi:uncharacterized protein